MKFNQPLSRHLKSLSFVEALFDDVPDIVFFVKDEKGRYAAVNHTLALRCGAARKADVIGRTAAEVYPAPFGGSYLEQDLHVLRTGELIKDKLELQLYLHHKLGWCLTNKIAIRGDDAAIVGMIGISKDLHIVKNKDERLAGIAASVDYIREHYHEPMRVKELADMASLSVYQLEQRIKRIFQVTPNQFIVRTRIDAARERLRRTDAGIAEIAAECGFYDQSAFAHQFKAVTGLTPSQYRVVGKMAPA